MPAAGRQQNLGSQPGRGKQNRGSHSDCEMPDSKSVLERQRAGAGAAQGTWWSFSVTSSALGPQLGRTCQPLGKKGRAENSSGHRGGHGALP